MRRSFKIGLSILILVAGVVLYAPAAKRVSLYRLEHSDPASDADRAIARGDLRLAAVHLFRTHVPVLDSVLGIADVYSCVLHRVGPYTSDVTDAFQEQYNSAALNYARVYNRRILERAGHCQKAAA